MVQKVSLDFKGHIEVEINADPEDPEAWAEALARTWETLSEHKIAKAAKLSEHTILPGE